jgi:hypothetical protein
MFKLKTSRLVKMFILNMYLQAYYDVYTILAETPQRLCLFKPQFTQMRKALKR